MLHDGGEDERAHEGDAERVGHGLVVLLEGVLIDVESQLLVEVLEEDAAHVVALADDDGVLLAQLVEVGEGGAKHGVRAHVGMAAPLVEILQARLYRGDVAHDAVGGQEGHHLVEGGQRVLHGHGVDDQLRLEVPHFLQGLEPLAVIGEAQPLGVFLVGRHLVVEAEQVDEEAPHLARSHDQYLHGSRHLLTISNCWRTLSSCICSNILATHSGLKPQASPWAPRFSSISE